MKPEIIDNVNKPSHYQGRYGRGDGKRKEMMKYQRVVF